MDLSNYRKVYALALPIMLSNASVPLVGIVDTAVMGRMDSAAYLSAVAIGAVLFSGIFWAFGFLKMGTGGLVAQAFGRQDVHELHAIFARAVTIALLLAVAIMLAGTPLFNLGLWAMGGSTQLHALTADYYFVRLFAAPATLMSYVVIGTLVGQQKMREVFYLQLILNLSNVVLNLAFFEYTDWHIKGVAVATVISEYSALATGLYLLRAQFKVSAARWIAALKNTVACKEFFAIGRDLFVRTMSLTFAFYWITALGSRLGDTTLALNAILAQMLHFTAYALDGFAMAAEALTGSALGQRNRKALWRDVKACTWGALVVALAFTAVYAAFGQSLVNAMTTLPQVRALAPSYLLWIVIGPIIGVWSFLLDGVFIGTTHTREMRNGMLISLTVFLLSAHWLVPQWSNHGLWLSYHLFMLARALTLGVWLPRILRAADRDG